MPYMCIAHSTDTHTCTPLTVHYTLNMQYVLITLIHKHRHTFTYIYICEDYTQQTHRLHLRQHTHTHTHHTGRATPRVSCGDRRRVWMKNVSPGLLLPSPPCPTPCLPGTTGPTQGYEEECSPSLQPVVTRCSSALPGALRPVRSEHPLLHICIAGHACTLCTAGLAHLYFKVLFASWPRVQLPGFLLSTHWSVSSFPRGSTEKPLYFRLK